KLFGLRLCLLRHLSQAGLLSLTHFLCLALLLDHGRFRADVGLATRRSEIDLTLTFAELLQFLFVARAVTTRTAHTAFVERALLVLLGDRHAAGVTLVVTAFLQRVIHRHTVVEHETLALPQRFRLRHLL